MSTNKKPQYPYWRHKKKKKHQPSAPSTPPFAIQEGDQEIAEGSVVDGTRLVQLVYGKVPKFYVALLRNPILDPNLRYLVVVSILQSPNSQISLRRKHDLICDSLEIHYYSLENKNKIKKYLVDLKSQLLLNLQKAAKSRIQELKSHESLGYKTDLKVRESLNLIQRMRIFNVPSEIDWFSRDFWHIAEDFICTAQFPKSALSFKHVNDVTHSKLCAVWNIKYIDEIADSEFVNSKSHPIAVADIYFSRIALRNSLTLFPDFLTSLQDLSLNFDAYLAKAKIREAEIEREAQETQERLKRYRAEKLEELARNEENMREIERVRRETVEKYVAAVRAGLIQPVQGGYSGGGSSWGASNNSIYQKGG